jgi:hypothetical protein
MDIRFVSNMTADDEDRLAEPLLNLVCSVLDQLPIAYSVVIETVSGTTVQRGRASHDSSRLRESPPRRD